MPTLYLDPKGSIFLGFGISITTVFIVVTILIGMILGLVLKKKRKLHVQPQTDLTSSNIYSHTKNYIQQRYIHDCYIICVNHH